MREIRLLRNRILIQQMSKEGAEKSGLYLLSEGKGDIHYGKIIRLGPGYVKKDNSYQRMNYKEGQIIAYGRNAGIEWQDETQNPTVKYLIITEDDVYATVKIEKKLVPTQFSEKGKI